MDLGDGVFEEWMPCLWAGPEGWVSPTDVAGTGLWGCPPKRGPVASGLP